MQRNTVPAFKIVRSFRISYTHFVLSRTYRRWTHKKTYSALNDSAMRSIRGTCWRVYWSTRIDYDGSH